jgi:hypothetical protein
MFVACWGSSQEIQGASRSPAQNYSLEKNGSTGIFVAHLQASPELSAPIGAALFVIRQPQTQP